MAKKIIVLDCGVDANQYKAKGIETLEISIVDFYNGHGLLNDFKKLSDLFLELHEKGFSPSGLSRVEGYYNSTDDLLLDAIKIVK